MTDPYNRVLDAEDAAVHEERSRTDDGQTIIQVLNFLLMLKDFHPVSPEYAAKLITMLKDWGYVYVGGGRWVDPDTAAFCDQYNAWEERYNG